MSRSNTCLITVVVRCLHKYSAKVDEVSLSSEQMTSTLYLHNNDILSEYLTKQTNQHLKGTT